MNSVGYFLSTACPCRLKCILLIEIFLKIVEGLKVNVRKSVLADLERVVHVPDQEHQPDEHASDDCKDDRGFQAGRS